jgi:CBS-domain-containing membrane protein
MTPDALIYVMTAAVVVGALALLLQALMLVGVYKSTKATKEQVEVIAGHAESLVQSAQRTVEQTRKQINEVSTKAGEILDLSRKQLVRIDEVLGEATMRAKSQMDRVEMVLDDSVSRIHETANLIHDGILRPVREINGFVVGIRTALEYLVRGQRTTVADATHDDEMFI